MHIRLLPKETETAWLPYAWLGFLVFFIIGMFAPNVTTFKIVISIAGLIVFLASFFRCYWIDQGPRLFGHISLMIALGVGFSVINPGASVFFHYASFFAGRLGKWQHSVACIVAILVIITVSWHYGGLVFQYLLVGGIVSAALGAMSMQIYAAERVRLQLARSEEEREHLATIAERERIARDLHDVVGHALTVIALKSEVAERALESEPDVSRKELNELRDIASDALSEVRKTVTGYRQSGIQKAILDMQQSLRTAAVNPDFSFPTEPLHLSAAQESALIMVLREAVTNVIRHAQAKECSIKLIANDERIQLTLQDDGIGTDNTHGNGISGMKERISELGGEFSVQRKDGTLITVQLPIEHE